MHRRKTADQSSPELQKSEDNPKDTSPYIAKGRTFYEAYETLRHKLSVEFQWPEDDIFYRKVGIEHRIYGDKWEFRFRAYENKEKNECTVKVDPKKLN